MAFSSLSTDVMEQIHEYNTKNLEFRTGHRKSCSIVCEQGSEFSVEAKLF